MYLSYELPKLSIGMSAEQKRTLWDVTKMVVAVLLALSSFGLVNLYKEQVEENKRQNELLNEYNKNQTEMFNSLNNRMQQFEIKMVRVEYELKLK